MGAPLPGILLPAPPHPTPQPPSPSGPSSIPQLLQDTTATPSSALPSPALLLWFTVLNLTGCLMRREICPAYFQKPSRGLSKSCRLTHISSLINSDFDSGNKEEPPCPGDTRQRGRTQDSLVPSLKKIHTGEFSTSCHSPPFSPCRESCTPWTGDGEVGPQKNRHKERRIGVGGLPHPPPERRGPLGRRLRLWIWTGLDLPGKELFLRSLGLQRQQKPLSLPHKCHNCQSRGSAFSSPEAPSSQHTS
nr:uncharacterized protein LOC131759521 [Kogia breviceps]